MKQSSDEIVIKYSDAFEDTDLNDDEKGSLLQTNQTNNEEVNDKRKAPTVSRRRTKGDGYASIDAEDDSDDMEVDFDIGKTIKDTAGRTKSFEEVERNKTSKSKVSKRVKYDGDELPKNMKKGGCDCKCVVL